jgi:hypothetical protein
MQSGTQPSSSEPPPVSVLSNLIGTLIALLTLMSPIAIVKHFSSSDLPVVQTPTLIQGALK